MNYGWVCQRCKRSNAPTVLACSCDANVPASGTPMYNFLSYGYYGPITHGLCGTVYCDHCHQLAPLNVFSCSNYPSCVHCGQQKWKAEGFIGHR